MSALAFHRSGHGAPLVLLHGLGSSSHAWDPVTLRLAETFDVLAVDLPGFGGSPVLAGEATPAAMAQAVGELLDELGVVRPHVAGNSLGGWVALELAGQRTVASVALLSPAGLWRGPAPLYCRLSLRLSRALARHLGSPVRWLLRFRLGRLAVLGQTHGRPTRLSVDYARRVAREFGGCPGFAAALAGTADRCYLPDQLVQAPITVAFGERDWLLRSTSRHVDQLPPGTRVGVMPGCGHVPMADDPALVAAFLEASAAVGDLRPVPLRTQ